MHIDIISLSCFFVVEKLNRERIFFEKEIIVEIFEIQSKMRITIFIKTVFEKKIVVEYKTITKIQDFVIIFQNIEMINIFIEILKDRITDQLKTKFAIIDAEKRRIHLRHLLTQTEIEREIDFFVVSVAEIETKCIRNDFEMRTILSLKKIKN